MQAFGTPVGGTSHRSGVRRLQACDSLATIHPFGVVVRNFARGVANQDELAIALGNVSKLMTFTRLFLMLTVCALWAGCATEDSSRASGTGLQGFLSRPVKLEGSY